MKKGFSYLMPGMALLLFAFSVQAAIPPSPSSPPSSTHSRPDIGQTYRISWSPIAGAVAYQLQEKAPGQDWQLISHQPGLERYVSHTKAGVYSYRYRGINTVGRPPYGPAMSVTVEIPPPPIPVTPTRPIVPSPVITGQNFTVSWGSVSGATSYTLYRDITPVYSGSGTSRNQNITTPGDYSYSVKACNVSGCSSTSGAALVKVMIPVPPAPASAPTSTHYEVSKGFTYRIEWPSNNLTFAYQLQERAPGGSWTLLAHTSNLYRYTAKTVAGIYSYRYRRVNNTGESGYSPAASVTVLPEMPSAPVAGYNGSAISLTWSVEPGVSYYALQYRNDAGPEINSAEQLSGGNHQLTGVTLGLPREFRISACLSNDKCSGWSPWSNQVLPVPVVPAAPVASVAGQDDVTLNWISVTYANNYRVEYSNDQLSWIPSTGTFNGTTHTWLGAGTIAERSYRLRACNDSGCSEWSSPSNTISTTSLGLASLVSPVTDEMVSEQLCFEWQLAPGAGYYTIQVSNDSNFDTNSKRWVLPDLTQASACWSTDFIANPTAGTTPNNLPNGTYYWRVKAMDGLTASGPNATFTEHRAFNMDRVANRKVIFIHTDLLGSPVAETNEQGEQL